MNLPYDATKREIEQLVKEFAEIDDIAIPRDKYDFITWMIFRLLELAELVVMHLSTLRGQKMQTNW